MTPRQRRISPLLAAAVATAEAACGITRPRPTPYPNPPTAAPAVAGMTTPARQESEPDG